VEIFAHKIEGDECKCKNKINFLSLAISLHLDFDSACVGLKSGFYFHFSEIKFPFD
jgi:hypothetical protein